MTEKILTQSQLKSLFTYDSETGTFCRIAAIKGSGPAGSEAGSPANGYLTIMIGGRNFRCHRLAWLYVHGKFPAGFLDHINRIKHDNRIANLRIASKKQNAENTGIQSNNKSGYRGVFWNSQKSKWEAKIKYYGKSIYLGFFDNPKSASRAYQQKAQELFTHFVAQK